MDRPLLLIDGDCGFCRTWAGRIARALDSVGARPIDIDAASAVDLDALGVPLARTESEVVLVLVDGRHVGGAQAFAQWLVWAGGPAGLLGRALALPGVRQLAQLAYRIIAANRYRLPGSTAACALPAVRRPHSENVSQA